LDITDEGYWVETDVCLYNLSNGYLCLFRRCQLVLEADTLRVNPYWAAKEWEAVPSCQEPPAADESGILTLLQSMVQKAVNKNVEEYRSFILRANRSLEDLLAFFIQTLGDDVFGEVTVLRSKLLPLQH